MPDAGTLTIAAIDRIVSDHWERFARPEVVGVGVAEREGQLRFVIRVEHEKHLRRLAKEFGGQQVDNLPVHVEFAELLPIDAPADAFEAPPEVESRTLRGALGWLVDRPGYLVVAGMAAATVALIVARPWVW